MGRDDDSCILGLRSPSSLGYSTRIISMVADAGALLPAGVKRSRLDSGGSVW
jgi:hypothetical protein